MKGFHLVRGCNGNDMKFWMDCVKLTYDRQDKVETTGCNDMKNRRLEYLDRHKPTCTGNYIMKGWRVLGNGCSYALSGGQDMRIYSYCEGVKGFSGESTHNTGCNDIDGKQNEYLDRHKVECPAGKVLKSWGMTRSGCSGGNQRIQFTCAFIDHNPPAENCEMAAWSAWGACNKQCGGGQQIRTRGVTKEPKYGGAACPANRSESRGCNNQACDVDCEVSEYGEFGECSKDCGGGERTKTRTVTKAQVGNGKACPVLKLSEPCNETVCLLPSEAGDSCKTFEWYEELCKNQFDAKSCKGAGCSYKKEECVPSKRGKKIKCKKLKTKVGEANESICGCFTGCNLKSKESKKEGKPAKSKCSGVHQYEKEDKE